MALGQIGQTGWSVQSLVEEEPRTEQGSASDFPVEDFAKGHTLMNDSATWDVVHRMVSGQNGVSGQTVQTMARFITKIGQDNVTAFHAEVNPVKVYLWNIKRVTHLTVLVSLPKN